MQVRSGLLARAICDLFPGFHTKVALKKAFVPQRLEMGFGFEPFLSRHESTARGVCR